MVSNEKFTLQGFNISEIITKFSSCRDIITSCKMKHVTQFK